MVLLQPRGGGEVSTFVVCAMGICHFQGIVFTMFSKQIFWSRQLSEKIKRGIRSLPAQSSNYILVKTFYRCFQGSGFFLEQKIWSQVQQVFRWHTSQSSPPPRRQCLHHSLFEWTQNAHKNHAIHNDKTYPWNSVNKRAKLCYAFCIVRFDIQNPANSVVLSAESYVGIPLHVCLHGNDC